MILGFVAAAAIGLSSAFFSDTETSTGNILQAGELDLKIDNESYYNGVLNVGTTWGLADLPGHLFFDFHDLKPDDYGEDTISLHAENDYWACMTITMTNNDDGTCTEPELLDDTTCTNPGAGTGELAQNLNFAFWIDDGDNVLEDDEDEKIFKQGDAFGVLDDAVITLADSITNLFEASGPLLGTKTYYIGKAWCFGTLTPAPDAQDGVGDVKSPVTIPGGGFLCDGESLNNATQTDIVKGDIEFTADQARNNPDFFCQPNACVPVWAGSVESTDQGTRKNSTAVLAARTDPTTALVAQTLGNVYDSPVIEGTFYSLGFNIGFPEGGWIIVEFDNPIFPVPGVNNDIQVFEVTGGSVSSPYPDEIVKVEAAQFAVGPWTPLSTTAIRDESLDIAPLAWAKFIRVTDVSPIAAFEATADAYDLDGVRAFCGTPD